MGEIATQQDVLDKYHTAGFSGGTAPHSTECVTKGNLTNPSGLPSDAQLTVASGYNTNECVLSSDINIYKLAPQITYELYFRDAPLMTTQTIRAGLSVVVVSSANGVASPIELYYDTSSAYLSYDKTGTTEYTVYCRSVSKTTGCSIRLPASGKSIGLNMMS